VFCFSWKMSATRPNAFGKVLRGFFADHQPRIRGVSSHTVLSHRDAFTIQPIEHLIGKKTCLAPKGSQNLLSRREPNLECPKLGFQKAHSYVMDLQGSRTMNRGRASVLRTESTR